MKEHQGKIPDSGPVNPLIVGGGEAANQFHKKRKTFNEEPKEDMESGLTIFTKANVDRHEFDILKKRKATNIHKGMS